MINHVHVAVKIIGHNLLFINKPVPINDWLPQCRNAAGRGPRDVKTDVCSAISIQIPAELHTYEILQWLHRMSESFPVKMTYYLLK